MRLGATTGTCDQSGGYWANVYLYVDGVDSDDADDDADYYLEWEDVDYNADGRIDASTPRVRAVSQEEVDRDFWVQLSGVDAYFRQQGR